MMIVAVSLWQMTTWSLGMDYRWIVISGALQGLGMGLVFMPLNLTAFATLDPKYRTEARAC